MLTEKPSLSILASGVALGVYIPALSLQYQLKRRDTPSEVEILENLLQDSLLTKVPETKKVFHKNFKVARMGQKMARDIWPSLDRAKIETLFARWAAVGEKRFVVYSGFWLTIIEAFKNEFPFVAVKIDVIHMDSIESPSWLSCKDLLKSATIHWLFNGHTDTVEQMPMVSENAVIPWEERKDRYIVHGGGWGMGTYQSKCEELLSLGVSLDIMAYYADEIDFTKKNVQYCMVDPSWNPWAANAQGNAEYPPVAFLDDTTVPQFNNREEYHELYYRSQKNKAIISKPGGSTIVDSFASATPFIFLEPFGPHEQKNADLWVAKGFGLYYDTWKESGFSDSLLEQVHTNITIAHSTVPDFYTQFNSTEALYATNY